MKNITEFLNINESSFFEPHNDKTTITEGFRNCKKVLGDTINISVKGSQAIQDAALTKYIAGHVIEAAIRNAYKGFKSSLGKFEYPYEEGQEKLDNFYDFSWGGDKYEVKTYQSGKISNATFSDKQQGYKDKLMFIIVEYVPSETSIAIKNIMLIEGPNLKISGKHLISGNKSDYDLDSKD